jgi:hypothetical protein
MIRMARRVKIDDVTDNRRLSHVGFALKEAEARELRDVLDQLLLDASEAHEHVSSADYQTELTVWIARGA